MRSINKLFCALALSAGATNAVAQPSEHATATDLHVTHFRQLGPLSIPQPIATDSVDLRAKAFDESTLLNTPLRLNAVTEAQLHTDSVVILEADKHLPALHLIGFNFKNGSFARAAINIKGSQNFELYVNGRSQREGQTLNLTPATHEVVVKCLTAAGTNDTLHISIKPEKGNSLCLADNGTAKKDFTINELLRDWHYTNIDLSPNGQLALISRYNYTPDGKANYRHELRNLRSGQILEQRQGAQWMPHSNRYIYTRTDGNGKRELLSVDPITHDEKRLAQDLPDGSWQMMPNERQLIFSIRDEGEREKNQSVREIVHPDDRQTGWRSRTKLALYDLATGLMRPLTTGYNNIYMQDASQDSRYLLISKYEDDIQRMRPTSLTSLMRLDLETMNVDTLVWQDGFLERAHFSPDGKQVLLEGSPEALEGIGNVLPEGTVPSMIDRQLYIMDLTAKQTSPKGIMRYAVRPITREFNPSVTAATWSTADGMIYFTAEDKDFIHLFRFDTKRNAFTLVDTHEDIIGSFALAADAPLLIYSGQSASNADRLYTLQTRALKADLCEAPNAQQHQPLNLGKCEAWTYVNAKGDSVCCRYYLPATFDAEKKYPMITYYYGGCSPSSRNFDSRYPPHVYAAQGYIVLVVNPSGATGFGQEWSSRHVNTAGKGVAEDIIGAVKTFCNEHTWVNPKKIGCIGASYGGFMTQYLQTQTDIFAAAISHAGISDHTSYWGEGFWGYSYSQTSMGGSYPWTRKDLYVDQSPLFNADKIHTPLLFLHGAADTNVPVGESIQMYTALKLLGRPTAFVVVEGENHWIQDYEKRISWQHTIEAWFARWLKDEPEWWQAMYPDKKL